MSYGVIYTLPFKSRKETSYLVEIQKEDYQGEVTELSGNGESPFSVEIDDEEFLYTPTRFSTATIRVVGNDYLQSLYSTGYQQYRVNFRKENDIVWTGFITPELYTQDYTSSKFVLEIQAVSAMSTLEYINYKQQGSDGRIFVSLWSLLTGCVISANAEYGSIVLPHVYAKTASDYADNVNVLEQMTISEQNFFDEDDKPMTLKDVLSELCKFLNWTCIDYTGKLYFIDIDHNGKYWEYTPDFSEYSIVDKNEMNVQNIGFAGSDHSLDILGGYNKCSVKTSNYNVGEVFPEEDYDILQKLHYMADYIWPSDDTKAIAKRFYYPSVYKMRHFSEINLSEVSSGDLANYNTDSGYGTPDIVDYSFEDLIQVRGCAQNTTPNVTALGQNTVLVTFENDLPSCVYGNGVMALNCYMQGCTNGTMNTIGKAFTRTPRPSIKCRLSIGSHYWNGTVWAEDNAATFILGFNENSLAEGGFVQVDGNRTLGDGYDGLSGVIIPLPSNPIAGKLVFEMMGIAWGAGSGTFPYSYLIGYYLKDLSLKYQLSENFKTNDESDRIYENVITENYINELDEIENKISSYNYDGLCYSKVLLGNQYLADNLYSFIYGGIMRIEEQLIKRIIAQYSATKIKLTQVLVNDARITPITLLTDKYMPGKKFIITGGEIDFKIEQFNCKMIENNGKY